MIGWRDEKDEIHRGSLFAVFAALSRGDAWSFPALRPHQREPWHAFTVQVAALALIRAGRTDLPTDEAGWRDLLLALTKGEPEPWELVVDDWTKPALLQPPVSDKAAYKSLLPTPDALDMLVTSKDHDVKKERMAEADEEDWLFALVTLQTYEGFLGAGNYGISRMNGGFASRMVLGVRPASGGAAAAFRRDVARLVADANARSDRRTGTPLLWTEPWDGTHPLDYTKLDELYVEICRRIRLRRGPRGIEALAAGSKVTRVEGAELKGKTKDPWAPIKKDYTASVTPTGAGFGYRQITYLIDRNQVVPPLLAKTFPEDDPEGLSLVAAALVRGQGKTEGLHRRKLRIPRIEAAKDDEPVASIDKMGEVAVRRTQEAGKAASLLTRALAQAFQGGPTDRDVRGDDSGTKAKVTPWRDVFDDVVDEQFFDGTFWADVASARAGVPYDGPTHSKPWRERLSAIVRRLFEEAVDAGPRTEMRRLQAWARARNQLDRNLDDWVKEVAW